MQEVEKWAEKPVFPNYICNKQEAHLVWQSNAFWNLLIDVKGQRLERKDINSVQEQRKKSLEILKNMRAQYADTLLSSTDWKANKK